MRPYLPLLLLPCFLAVACGPTNSAGDVEMKKTTDKSSSPQQKTPTKEKGAAMALVDKGIKNYNDGAVDKAMTEFTEAIHLDPNCLQAYLNRGYAYGKRREYDKAIADYTEAIRLDPKEPFGYYGRGKAYHEKRNLDKAIEDYNEVIRLDPNKSFFRSERGKAYSENGEQGKAIADFTEAIRLDPKSHFPYAFRAHEYRKRREYEKAVADITEAIRLDPEDPDGYGVLARIFACCPKEEVRDGKKAVTLATKACELSNWKTPFCLESLAAAHAETGNFKEAIRWQKAAIDLKPVNDAGMLSARLRLIQYESGKPHRID
jgi:tetratricopeptide (TPR) repeat protein